MDTENEQLYHYTNGEGLLGILKSGCLWATHVSFLNDSQEHKIGWTTYRQALKEVKDGGANEPVRQLAATAIMRLDEVEEAGPLAAHDAHFVTSFSEERDDLAQWRGYGGRGPRFCVAFKKATLEGLAANGVIRFDKVSYDAASARAQMKAQFIDAAGEMVRRWLTPPSPYTHPNSIHSPEFWSLARAIVLPAVAFLKDDGFEREAEWRLHATGATLSDDQLGFRAGPSYLVPYAAIPLPEGCIDAVWVGPTPHPTEAKLAVTRLLTTPNSCNPHMLWQGGLIENSSIPYRDW